VSLAIAFTTVERPRAAQRLIASIRRYHPEAAIYVADQSRPTPEIEAFYAEHDVRVSWMEYDAGVSASRNRLADEIEEEYIWLCDDDFVFSRDTSAAAAIDVLDAFPEIGVVGGRLIDLAGGRAEPRHWEHYMHYEPRHRTLTLLPIYHAAPQVETIGQTRFYRCDVVMMFAVFRRRVFGTIRWDDRIKTNGEHEDFFLNLKLNSDFGVAYVPEMIAFHRQMSLDETVYGGLRKRTEGWRLLLEKWNIDQLVDIGFGVRCIDNPAKDLPISEVDRRWYADPSDPADARRPFTGPLPWSGHPIFLREVLGHLGTRGIDAYLRSQDGPDPPGIFIPEHWRLSFRHTPVVGGDDDFIVWCKVAPSPLGTGSGPDVLQARAKWFTAKSGTPLSETSKEVIPLSRTRDWTPLVLDLPPPAGPDDAVLRFEIVADSIRGTVSLCTGFLLRQPSAQGQSAPDCPVLALGTLFDPSSTPSTLSVGPAGARAGGEAPEIPVTARRLGAGAAGLWLLEFETDPSGRVLLFHDWPGLGKKRFPAQIPRAGETPIAIALPALGKADHSTAITAHGPGGAVSRVRVKRLGETIGRPRSGTSATPTPSANVSVVVTGCGRPDLLQRSLDSFFAHNKAPIAQFIVIEDGPAAANAALMTRYRDRDITWIATEERVGLLAAIDQAYSRVDHPYIFHIGHGWEFYRGGFIEKSLAVLEAEADCIQVWLQALLEFDPGDISPECRPVNGVPVRDLKIRYRNACRGFSLNPGLRRTTDYARLGRYTWLADQEAGLSDIYRQLGYRAVVLAGNSGQGYVLRVQ
jgi:GT2 family glycosyltransferase